MSGNLVLVTAPTNETVARQIAKAHFRVDGTDEDTLIDALLISARTICEDACERSFITTTWKYFVDAFNEREICFPRGKLQSVTHVKYYDVDGNLQTLDSGSYQVDTQRERGRIVLAKNKSWPSIDCSKINPIEIQFVAGYGDNATDVPEPIKLAITQLALHWFENRQPVITGGTVNELPMFISTLLFPYRLNRW